MATLRGPTPDEIKHGSPYCLMISADRGSSGWILDDPETADARWHYTSEATPFHPLNLFRKPDFLLLDRAEREVLRIRRRRRLPARFDILQNGEVVGTIRLRSIVQYKYTIELQPGPTWTFRMTPFKLQFHGESNINTRAWVVVGPSKMQWNLLTQPGTDDLRLVAALAFIHREWWWYA